MRIREGTTTIVGSPCYNCVRKILSKKIKRLRYIGTYDNPLGGDKVEELCRRRGVVVEYVDVKEVLPTLRKAIEFLQGPGGAFKNLPKIMIKSEEK